MKPSLRFLILAITSCSSLGIAEEERILPEPDATTARVIGDIPDGTPPPAQPPKPKFIVPAKDVVETKTHQQGGREITIQRIAPIALPPSDEEAHLIDLTDPLVQERIAKFRAGRTNRVFLLVGATVYHWDDSPPRSLVQIWPQAEGEPVTVWSSANFAFLSGLSTFAGSSGEAASLMMSWSVTNLERNNALQRKFARQFKAPQIPDLPPGKATFVIASGNPTPQTLASIQSLHDLYNNELDRLKTAYEGRELAQRLHAAELKANPPQPKDIVLNYWRIESSSQTGKKGAAR